ncbi:TD and POZ domain-containing protein 5-like [Stegodyphus dumicola]|uniref:TD and POZ domain-containing protein 5-like n=1 Tax=Stegodyphus dumicola TaxID=202533 RepID=UPI0015AC44E2|nr:TD and POZ domain-containing protein 5-like [Stegodyphus dumicola]
MASSIKDLGFRMEQELTQEITVLNFSTYDVGQCDILRLNHDALGMTVFTEKIFPNGNNFLNEGYVSIEISNIPQNVILKCVASVIDIEGNSRYIQSFTNETSDTVIGLERFVNRNTLLTNHLEYLPDDKLTIQLEISSIIASEEGVIIDKPSENACKIEIKDSNHEIETFNFQIETKDGKSESLILKKGAWFMRNPLCKKSPVFAKLLSAAMQEKERNKVTITDMDHNTLKNFLSFVHSDSMIFENVQDIVDLYEAADKYEVLDLKYECARDLIRNLRPENVCNALLLADMHSDRALKYTSMFYIQEFLDEVSETESWKLLMENFPGLADETMNFSHSEIKEKLSEEHKTKDQPSCSKTTDSNEVFQFYS